MVVFYIFQIYIVWMEQSILLSMNDEFSDAHCELICPHEAEGIYLSLPSCFRSPQKEENILNSKQDQCCLRQLWKEILEASSLQHFFFFFFFQITAPDQNWCGFCFPTISPGGYEWGYEAAKLIVAFNLCEGTAVGARNDDREVPKTVVQWGRIKESLPIATREGVRGLSLQSQIWVMST